VRVRNRAFTGAVLRLPLVRTSGTLGELPLVAEEVREEVVAPLGGRRGPRHLETAGDRVAAVATFVAALPAEALQLEACAFWLDADMCAGIGGSMRLAEGVPSGDERHRFFVVHRHSAERLANVPGRGDGIRLAVWSFRIHVDETHLHGGERILELTVAAIPLVAEPRGLGSPVDVLFGFPDVLPSAGEAERLESHRLQGAVAGKHHQVGPRKPAVVPLLDGPEQTARLVEVRVVGPAAERREAQCARSRAAAAVADAVRARTVPRHPDEEGTVVAEVGRPPVLRGRHHRDDLSFSKPRDRRS
jgi:hypothetical protein